MTKSDHRPTPGKMLNKIFSMSREFSSRLKSVCSSLPHRRVTTLFRVTLTLVTLLVVTGLTISYQSQNEVRRLTTFETTVDSTDVDVDVIIRADAKELKVSRCNCHKTIFPSHSSSQPHELDVPRFTAHNTTCSNDTFQRGFGQKVIGFTFYEPRDADVDFLEKKNRLFFEGIRENLELMKKFYPGWIMRLYYKVSDSSPMLSDLCELACSEPDLDLCDVEQIPRLGNASILYPILWRFLPVIDVQVDTFLSRDLDSRINPREVAGVQEFLSSDKHIHIMRDHPAHVAYMMGGTWGAKVDQERLNFFTSFKKLFQDGLAYVGPDKGGGYDQIALTRFVYPWAKKVAIAHDSFHCKKFPYTAPFPVQRVAGIGNYVGSVVSLNATLGFTEGSVCPYKCRPKDHKDWIYC